MLTRVDLKSGNHGGDKRGNPEAKGRRTAHQMMVSTMPKATGRRSANSLKRCHLLESRNGGSHWSRPPTILRYHECCVPSWKPRLPLFTECSMGALSQVHLTRPDRSVGSPLPVKRAKPSHATPTAKTIGGPGTGMRMSNAPLVSSIAAMRG